MKALLTAILISSGISGNSQEWNGAMVDYNRVVENLPLAKDLETRMVEHIKAIEEQMKVFNEHPSYPDQGNMSNEDYRELINNIALNQEKEFKEFQEKAELELSQYQQEASEQIRTFIRTKLNEFTLAKDLDFISADPDTFVCPSCLDLTDDFIAFVSE